MTLARPLPLLLLALVAGLAFIIGLNPQLGTHATERHGDEAAEVRDMFNGNSCPRGDIAHLESKTRGLDLWLCFLKDSPRVGVWVLCKNFPGICAAGEVTAFLTKEDKTVKYLQDTVFKDSYIPVSGIENIPPWLWEALNKVK
jgi:hypothetical protein